MSDPSLTIEELAEPQGERMATILFQSALAGPNQRISLSKEETARVLAGAWRAGYEAAQHEFNEAFAKARAERT